MLKCSVIVLDGYMPTTLFDYFYLCKCIYLMAYKNMKGITVFFFYP